MSIKSTFCVLSVFLVVLCITSTRCDVSHVVLGGESPVDTGTIEVLRKNIGDYLLELEHGGSPQMRLQQIYSASKQIVTGTLYTVEALLQTPDGAKKCQIRVLEKPWIDFCQVKVTCENGGHYEVTFNPNQISQDISHELKPIKNYLPPSVYHQPESQSYLSSYEPAKPAVSLPQNPFLNPFTTSHTQSQNSFANQFTTSQNTFLNQFPTTYVQQQDVKLPEFTTAKPFTTYKPLDFSFKPAHPFEFKPQTPVFKPQPLPTLPPLKHEYKQQPVYKPLPTFPPSKYEFKQQPAYKPLPTLPPFKQQPVFNPQPVYKPLPTLPPLKHEFHPQPVFKPQPVYKPLPTLPPLKQEFHPQPVYKPLPTLPPLKPLPTLPPYKPQVVPQIPQIKPQQPEFEFKPQQPQFIPQAPPNVDVLPPAFDFKPEPQHDFPIKPTSFPKPLPPKPELNVLPFDQLPQGDALESYLTNLFHDFMRKYEREYIAEPSEMAYRYDVFKGNFHTMHEHSKSDRLACEYSVTEFADLTTSEFERILGFDTSVLNVTDIETAEIPSDGQGRSAGGEGGEQGGEIPEHYDQREENLVTRVKFQGDCGACWAFVTTAVIEGLCAKRTKILQEFSEQSLIDCDNSNYGCKGGVPPNALKHIAKRGGLELEQIYPYVFSKSSCHFDPKTVRVKVAGSIGFKKNDEAGMARWLFKNGPILVGINADPLKYYKGGVLNPTPQLCSPKKINHGVTLIGYGVEVNTSTGEKLPYWIVKNQWGSRFGEDGYFRIARGKNACGLALWAYSAKLSNVPNNCLLNGA